MGQTDVGGEEGKQFVKSKWVGICLTGTDYSLVTHHSSGESS
jgi:hypothetical protein